MKITSERTEDGREVTIEINAAGGLVALWLLVVVLLLGLGIGGVIHAVFQA